MTNVAPEELPRRDRLLRVCALLSFAVPWSVAVAHGSSTPRFADDVALLRGLGLAMIGLEGLISAGLTALFELLPLASRLERAAWPSALALGAAGYLLFRITLSWQLTAKSQQHPRGSAAAPPTPLDGGLALVAALSSTLGPSFVTEGSLPGGHAVAAALALAALAVGTSVFDLGGRTAFVLGAISVATGLESRWTLLGLALALGVAAVLRRAPIERASITAFGAGFALAAAVPVALMAALLLSRSPTAELAFGLPGHGLSVDLSAVDRSAALSAWLSEVGLLYCGLAVCGATVGAFDARLRPFVLPLCVFIALDFSFGAAHMTATDRDPQGPARLVAIAALGASGALAVRLVIDRLRRARVPFATPAGALLVVYGFTLVFVSAEDSARAAEKRAFAATATWTTEALGSVPAGSALLIRSQPVLFRLLAERATRNTRPDMLLVPMALLERGGAHARLLAAADRELIPLVRELLLSGEPSEFALSALADARPTFVEPDLRLDARLYAHLTPQPFFTQFAAHPLGQSDRRLGLEQGERALSRVLARLAEAADADPGTRSIVATELGHRALVLAALGDREAAERALAELLALHPRAPLGLRLRERLAATRAGRVDVSGLVAIR